MKLIIKRIKCIEKELRIEWNSTFYYARLVLSSFILNLLMNIKAFTVYCVLCGVADLLELGR